MKKKKHKPSYEVVDSDTLTVRAEGFPMQKHQWDHLRSIVSKIHTPFRWFELIIGSLFSLSLTALAAALQDVSNKNIWFLIAGGSFLVMVLVTFFANRSNTEEQVTRKQAQDYMDEVRR